MPKFHKIVYFAGPGNVFGTFQHWRKRAQDPTELATTYSAQFFDLVQELGLKALIISSNAESKNSTIDNFEFVARPNPAFEKSGIKFYFFDALYWLWVIYRIVRFRANCIVISNMQQWWILSLLKPFRITIITALHCTFWPKGHRSKRISNQLLNKLNGIFWRHIPDATVAISPECAYQVREITRNNIHGELTIARAHYDKSLFSNNSLATWSKRPFRILYCGRIEASKGIFDLLHIAERLRSENVHDFVFEVVGNGSALDKFLLEIKEKQLIDSFECVGHLRREDMLRAYARAHIVIVPTTAQFTEGLNKVVIEAVLAGRPVIVTDVCPAVDVVQSAVIAVSPGDITGITSHIHRLMHDQERYYQLCANCAIDAEPFFSGTASWGGVLTKLIKQQSVRGTR